MDTSMKPSDAFLGVIDFFSNLVPGAIATFLLIQLDWVCLPTHWPTIERGSAEGWAIFLVAAYVFGHAIAPVAGICLDPLYDRVYARWRRASSKYVGLELGSKASWLRVLGGRIQHVWNKTNPENASLKVAKILKLDQIGKLAQAAAVQPDDISNTFWWAGSVVRSTTPAGALEIDALSAQSKLFRSIAFLLPFVALWTGWYNLVSVPGWAIALCLSLWRFMHLRWDATERTYEYFIVASVAPRGRDREGAT